MWLTYKYETRMICWLNSIDKKYRDNMAYGVVLVAEPTVLTGSMAEDLNYTKWIA